MNCDTEVMPETDVGDIVSDNEEFTPPEILDNDNNVFNNLTPIRSKKLYEAAYKRFMNWCSKKEVKNFSESILLEYFSELSEKYAPSSLWATYSMLRSTIDIKHKLKISNYSSLIAFLKEKNKGFKSKKAETLSAEHIDRFLREAPDYQFLAIKVALIFGVQGACKRQELCDLTVDDIIDKGDMLLVKILDTKTGSPRSFVVTDQFYKIYKKYASLRPTNLKTKRFFMAYRMGKCTTQNIGINTFGSMPKIIATYLKLPNAESYTGHTFRKTSTTLLAYSTTDLLSTKRHEEWKSNSVAQGYREIAVKWPSASCENSVLIDPLVGTTANLPMYCIVANKESVGIGGENLLGNSQIKRERDIFQDNFQGEPHAANVNSSNYSKTIYKLDEFCSSVLLQWAKKLQGYDSNTRLAILAKVADVFKEADDKLEFFTPQNSDAFDGSDLIVVKTEIKDEIDNQPTQVESNFIDNK